MKHGVYDVFKSINMYFYTKGKTIWRENKDTIISDGLNGEENKLLNC